MYRKPGLTPGRGQNIYNCDYDRPPGRGQVCDVDVKNWHPCISENNFNYHKSAPCIFLKLNKVSNVIVVCSLLKKCSVVVFCVCLLTKGFYFILDLWLGP